MPKSSTGRPQTRDRSDTHEYLVALARAFGGAVIFSIPIFMTAEMWELGVTAARLRLGLLMILLVPLLVGLSHLCGFEKTFGWLDDVIDAFAACAVGFITASVVLLLFGELHAGMRWDDVVGKVALQAVPGSIGALLAQSEFGQGNAQRVDRSGHRGEFLLMLIGALFLALSVAPTEEIIIIAQQMSTVHVLALITVSLMIMHAFVYAVEFRGSEPIEEGTTSRSLFLRYTIPGYALALLTSLFLLWTFCRTDGLAIQPLVTSMVVLGFPASIGAAAARLII
ncbi:TIGR02587 family membrane protein [Phragmitibacter flavus]|uniref:TIGR02587 family membrane protein n=1 Tax=Phragmitibacter flavus TaxID=2576071 RepID=A0A5R8KJJ1_9BACT|nr:TIGR02587 family membrane protein [Phragmitibacter flavus]TLD72486.1 TIGR02587 family membrane protein [Phragmitibacter flavus]